MTTSNKNPKNPRGGRSDGMKLYRLQCNDSDERFVEADSMAEAIDLWKAEWADENPGEDLSGCEVESCLLVTEEHHRPPVLRKPTEPTHDDAAKDSDE